MGFEEAFYLTDGFEGGYSNDPDDAGGETYRGISRVYHPGWEGWEYIDKLKGSGRIPAPDDSHLDPLVRLHYKRFYWDVNRLDEIDNDLVTQEIFDTGVNIGTVRAAKFLQTALNCLNRSGMTYPDLVEDGVIARKTLDAAAVFLSACPSDVPILLTIMNVLQGMHYIEYMKKSPIQEKYARGWFKRVVITK